MHRKYAKIVDRTSWTYRTMEKCEKQQRLLLLPQIQQLQLLKIPFEYDPEEDPRG